MTGSPNKAMEAAVKRIWPAVTARCYGDEVVISVKGKMPRRVSVAGCKGSMEVAHRLDPEIKELLNP